MTSDSVQSPSRLRQRFLPIVVQHEADDTYCGNRQMWFERASCVVSGDINTNIGYLGSDNYRILGLNRNTICSYPALGVLRLHVVFWSDQK